VRGGRRFPALAGSFRAILRPSQRGGGPWVDRVNGKTCWETTRPLFSGSWSTSVILRTEGERDLPLLGSEKLVAYDRHTGEQHWSANGLPAEAVAVSAIGR